MKREHLPLKNSLWIFPLMMLISACDSDLDLLGFIYSKTRVDERFDFSMEWNAAHGPREIVTGSDDYTLFMAGDSHVGGTENLDKLIDSAKLHDATALVFVGDLVSGKKEDYELFSNHLPDNADLMTMLMIGNHDLYYGGWESYKELFGSTVYTFTVRTPDTTDLYICLDSGGGTHGAKQLDWLKTTLEGERGKHRRCVVLTHVNFFRYNRTLSTNPQVDELALLLDLFTRHHVDMVVMGHDHARSEEFFGNTFYVTMDALMDSYKDPGYLVTDVTGGNLQYRFVSF